MFKWLKYGNLKEQLSLLQSEVDNLRKEQNRQLELEISKAREEQIKTEINSLRSGKKYADLYCDGVKLSWGIPNTVPEFTFTKFKDGSIQITNNISKDKTNITLRADDAELLKMLIEEK